MNELLQAHPINMVINLIYALQLYIMGGRMSRQKRAKAVFLAIAFFPVV